MDWVPCFEQKNAHLTPWKRINGIMPPQRFNVRSCEDAVENLCDRLVTDQSHLQYSKLTALNEVNFMRLFVALNLNKGHLINTLYRNEFQYRELVAQASKIRKERLQRIKTFKELLSKLLMRKRKLKQSIDLAKFDNVCEAMRKRIQKDHSLLADLSLYPGYDIAGQLLLTQNQHININDVNDIQRYLHDKQYWPVNRMVMVKVKSDTIEARVNLRRIHNNTPDTPIIENGTELPTEPRILPLNPNCQDPNFQNMLMDLGLKIRQDYLQKKGSLHHPPIVIPETISNQSRNTTVESLVTTDDDQSSTYNTSSGTISDQNWSPGSSPASEKDGPKCRLNISAETIRNQKYTSLTTNDTPWRKRIRMRKRYPHPRSTNLNSSEKLNKEDITSDVVARQEFSSGHLSRNKQIPSKAVDCIKPVGKIVAIPKRIAVSAKKGHFGRRDFNVPRSITPIVVDLSDDDTNDIVDVGTDENSGMRISPPSSEKSGDSKIISPSSDKSADTDETSIMILIPCETDSGDDCTTVNVVNFVEEDSGD